MLKRTPLKPRCANCGHSASKHRYGDNVGRVPIGCVAGYKAPTAPSWEADGCDCDGYKPRRIQARTPMPKATKVPMKRGKRLKAFNVKRGGKRFPKGYSPTYRRFARENFPCILAGRGYIKNGATIWHKCDGRLVFMHNRTDAQGVGDYGNGLVGCWLAHTEQHNTGIKSWAARWFGGTLATLQEKAQLVAAAYDAHVLGQPVL